MAKTSVSSTESLIPTKTVESSITKMLIIAILVYGLCYLSKLICAILSLYRTTIVIPQNSVDSSESNATLPSSTVGSSKIQKLYTTISYFCYFDGICNSVIELLPSFNSAVNFVIYFLVGQQFRNTFVEMIKGVFI